MVSSVTAYAVSTIFYEQMASFLTNVPYGFGVLWIIEIALVLFLGFKSFTKPVMATGGFILYSLINGITLSYTMMYYGIETMGQAFLAASATFAAMAIFGSRTKQDLSPLGRAAYIALIGIIISAIINFFVGSSAFDFFITSLTILVFAGLTAYDHQMIKVYYHNAQQNQQSLAGVAVFCALQLYMDFINLLIAFARIFGKD
ncbi:BAX inhibitor (BI)-1/YccA family protein [Vagococcus xieshaowenii]|uniref:BAX inhibitor (BI)-1/YccA family protein n=2 Tax=Vagococcus xieshaowenii TaxID=2562451 RepID=A0AAJ5EGR0_9ENTE|nr:BAX inhibitor (BI)-1/YccA family protein [Vagococcus xieshaowenii]TFZ42888.1 BAX inhibitor (BI)-1/YccA family protein [Vagococcus xieshaowenii]